MTSLADGKCVTRRRPSVTFAVVVWPVKGGMIVSIVRVGLAETKHFKEGYASIFGRAKTKTKKAKPAARTKKTGKTAKKKSKR
jgi:hypothetical protein